MSSVRPSSSSTTAEERNARDEAEVDGEPVPVLPPRFAAEDRHPRPRRDAVDADGDREHARLRCVGVYELERDEREEEQDGRPEPERCGIGRVSRDQPALARAPGDGVGHSTPGVEDGPDVPENDRDHDHPHPEGDVDERRGEICARALGAERRRRPDDDEERKRQPADDHAQVRREQEALQSLRERPSSSHLELRLRPERAERNEGDDENGGSSDEEEPARHGEVADAADAVRGGTCREGERDEGAEREGSAHGRTSRSAIGKPRSSSSTSKRPGIEATKTSRAALPGFDVGELVISVQVHVVGDVGADDNRDLLPLLDCRALQAADDFAASDDDPHGRHTSASAARAEAVGAAAGAASQAAAVAASQAAAVAAGSPS